MRHIITRPNGTKRIIKDLSKEKNATDQQFADQCDINNIMKRYVQTGTINHLSNKQGTYADVTKLPDYKTALDITIKAKNDFLLLPSDIRKRFQNDPQELITFLADSKNREEAEKIGLINKKPQTNANDDSTTNAKKQEPKPKTVNPKQPTQDE